MKIAIFENEFDTLEVAFNYTNKKYYQNKLVFKNFPRSQDFKNFDDIINFELIIIDLDLSSYSELDGFGLIKKIEEKIDGKANILILTGQVLNDDYHIENKLKHNYPILVKSINYNKLKNKFDQLGVKI